MQVVILNQWLKWSCEAGGGGTWRSQVGANLIPIPTPLLTNFVLSVHKITLVRFNQGVHTIAAGSNQSRGAEPPGPLTLTTVLNKLSYAYRTCMHMLPPGRCVHTIWMAFGICTYTRQRPIHQFHQMPCWRGTPGSSMPQPWPPKARIPGLSADGSILTQYWTVAVRQTLVWQHIYTMCTKLDIRRT